MARKGARAAYRCRENTLTPRLPQLGAEEDTKLRGKMNVLFWHSKFIRKFGKQKRYSAIARSGRSWAASCANGNV